MNIAKSLGVFFLDILETVVVAGAIFVVIYLFFFQPHQVVGESMYPNFKNMEYILTDKISYKLHDPKRGEVIVFKSPEDPDKDFIKRVIGLPGEHVKLQDGHFYINNQLLNETYLDPKLLTPSGQFLREGQEVTVDQGSYFVAGDNRVNSSDSRSWGLVTKDKIIGRAFIVYWPPPQFGLIPTATYDLK